MRTPPARFDPPIVGVSAHTRSLRDLVVRVSDSDARVLIMGESGVGKEVLARNLHRFSRRGDRAFVSVNCAALAPGTLESELFGHARGAFTGAVRSHVGLFEQAQGGTLFLDEIGEMPAAVQAKLLRVLQEREVRPMGAGAARRVDVRVLAATNADLPRRIAAGEFRQDLYYRINVIEVTIPPLRERPEDVIELVRHFSRTHGELPDLTEDALEVLINHHWPGNIRELQNELERIRALHGGRIRITPAQLSDRLTQPRFEAPLDINLLFEAPLPRAVSYLEQRLLRKTLVQTNWNKSRTARRLGLSRTGLLKKIKRYGIEPHAPPEEATD